MKGHGGRPFGYVGFLRVLRLSPIRMDDRGAAVPYMYLKVAIYGVIFFLADMSIFRTHSV